MKTSLKYPKCIANNKYMHCIFKKKKRAIAVKWKSNISLYCSIKYVSPQKNRGNKWINWYFLLFVSFSASCGTELCGDTHSRSACWLWEPGQWGWPTSSGSALGLPQPLTSNSQMCFIAFGWGKKTKQQQKKHMLVSMCIFSQHFQEVFYNIIFLQSKYIYIYIYFI